MEYNNHTFHDRRVVKDKLFKQKYFVCDQEFLKPN